jgi:aspartate carbamoyltransferase catalytic subunit
MRSFLGRDILSLKDFDRDDFFRVFEVCERLAPIARDRHKSDLLQNKILVTAFYQPSTRTRLSTETAMLRLGGSVTGFSDAKMTRAGDFYQESIRDTAGMLELYGDVLAMRHFQKGAPHEAARWASIPVLNCGDGWGEHPTQGISDLYTVWKARGQRLDGLHFVLNGDLRMRTMHSMSYAMTQFDIRATYVHPPEMALPDDIKDHISQTGLRFREVDHIEEAIRDADMIYIEPVVQPDYTKSRDERTGDEGKTPDNYRITSELMKKAKPDCMVFHSLPRMDELETTVDATRHAWYWTEAFNAVVTKMALLALVLGAEE